MNKYIKKIHHSMSHSLFYICIIPATLKLSEIEKFSTAVMLHVFWKCLDSGAKHPRSFGFLEGLMECYFSDCFSYLMTLTLQ